MHWSEIFIRRPVATSMLAVALFLTGIVALVQLPVAPLPNMDFPTIAVTARLPGADPETTAATLAAPLERRLGEIAGVNEITSHSGQGTVTIVVQFDLGRDIVAAARDVQAAINAAGSDMPADLPQPPSWRKFNPADQPILILAVTSDTLTPGDLYDACDTILAQQLSQVDGVAQITTSGADKPAIRVRVNPTQLAETGLSLEDVRARIQQANNDSPKGILDGPDQAASIAATDQLTTAAGYEPLILRQSDGSILRLSAIASVIQGVANDQQAGWYDAKPSVIVIIQKQAGANIIDTVDAIKAELPQLEAWMPAGTHVVVQSDRSAVIRASVHDVEITLLISIGLVILVVLASLGRATPTLAACVTVPLSLAGSYAAMWALGYTLDNISLMALTVSVGFVVDDAIVMIENIARHVERGQTALTAAIEGAREITFTVISITASLVAVFIPILFMGGVIGLMFREFAVTLTVGVVISALVSITVTPMVYGHLVSRAGEGRPLGFLRFGERLLMTAQRGYARSLGWAMRHQGAMLLLMAGTVALTVVLYAQVPKGFFPQQDNGNIIGITQGRTDISFKAMEAIQRQVTQIVLADPAVDSVSSFVGVSNFNSNGNQGRMFVTMKPESQRDVSTDQVIARLRPKLAAIEGVETFLQSAQDIRIGGRQSKSQYQFTLWTESLADLRTWTPRLEDAVKKLPGVEDVTSDQDRAGQQVNVDIDREAASRLGVSVANVDQVLEDSFAQRQISTIYTERNQYKVILEVDPVDRESPAALQRLYVAGTAGQVPLSAVARFEPGPTPLSVTHQGQFPSATITFNLDPEMSLGNATLAIEQAAADIHMPASVHTEFSGTAQTFAASLSSELLLIAAALATIYLVLGVLYENLVHPLTILSTLPSAGIGALLALLVTGTQLTVISVIGVILLMGIVKKNGIMLVDFAIERERRGGDPVQAIVDASVVRFRPIMMTTLAALLGALPLAVAYGTGSELRRPLGVAIIGGLIVSQALTLYTTPVVYLALDRLFGGRRPASRPVAEEP